MRLLSRQFASVQEPEKHYPKRLYHDVPGWVPEGAHFHIRLRVDSIGSVLLTEPAVAEKLIEAARTYHERGRWFCRLFLLMPDHLHALIAFPAEADMSRVVSEWKRFTARAHGIEWQSNYFDHRLRDERESTKTHAYILRNPVVKGLCSDNEAWPWQWCGENGFVWNPPTG